jgi:sulfide:quinone oxidoreductase
MKKLLILGAGTAGTMMAAKMRRHLDPEEWGITIVDQDNRHLYQPGFLFIPFDVYRERDVIKPRSRYIPPGVEFVISQIDQIAPEENQVRLEDGTALEYDFLIIATGSRIVPEETEGLTAAGWYKNAFDFYTLEGAAALAPVLENWEGGRLVVNVVEMPIKCPIAPLEFLFLADGARLAGQDRDRVRHAGGRRLHQAAGVEDAGRDVGGEEHQGRDAVRGRRSGRRKRRPFQLGRARDPLRPAGHDSDPHGQRDHRPF